MDLSRLFRARNVAFLGASPDSYIWRNMLKQLQLNAFDGELIAVNPKRREVDGVQCVASLRESEERVDLVILALPAEKTPRVVEECIECGVAAAVICTAGFGESGPTGTALANDISRAAAGSEIILVGTSSMGLIGRGGLAAFWGTAMSPIRYGNVAVVAQSGGLANLFVTKSLQRHLGLSGVVATGSETWVSAVEYVEHFVSDSATSVIVVIVERMTHVQRWVQVALRARRSDKVIILFKVGRSERGRMAALAHSGTLASRSDFVDAFCMQHAIISVSSFDDLFESAALLGGWQTRLPSRIEPIFVTVSGGDVILIDDAAELANLELPVLGGGATRKLEALVPHLGHGGNPIDVGTEPLRDPRLLREVISLVAHEGTGSVLAVRLPVLPDLLSNVISVGEQIDIPMLLFTRASEQLPVELESYIPESIPILIGLDRTVAALESVARYCRRLAQMSGSPAGDLDRGGEAGKLERRRAAEAILEGQRNMVIPESVGFAALACYGLQAARFDEVHNSADASRVAEVMGCPVALKVVVPALVHKERVGGVILNLSSKDAVERGYEELLRRMDICGLSTRVSGIMVQEMLPNPLEFYLGMLRDMDWGIGVIFGLGGRWVEVLKRSSLRLLPLSDGDAGAMVKEVVGNGAGSCLFRDYGDIAREALVHAVDRFGSFCEEVGHQFDAVDVNPLAFSVGGLKVLDCALVRGVTTGSDLGMER